MEEDLHIFGGLGHKWESQIGPPLFWPSASTKLWELNILEKTVGEYPAAG